MVILQVKYAKKGYHFVNNSSIFVYNTKKNKVNRFEIDNKAIQLINILIYGPVEHLSPKKHIFLEKSFEKYF